MKCASWECRSSAIPEEILSPATTGSTASARSRTVRECSTKRGIRSTPTSSAPMNSWPGAKPSGTLPLMGLNLGTGTPEQAAALVEYCNVDKGTKWSELRRKHGFAEPYKVKHWCLGNEMDGPWQIGHMTATEYGMKAQDAARQMHAVDPSLQLIACGSSGPFMPTYLEWDREVLEQCYDYVDASLAASLRRKHDRGNRRRQFEVSGHESEHGKADRGDRRGLRSGARAQAIAEEAVAFVRRMERLVSRPQRGRGERPRQGSAAFAGRGLQPGRCAAGGRDSSTR